MPTGIQGVLFDFDGTIADSWDLIMASMRYATREVLGRVVPDEELSAGIGTPLESQMLVLTGDDVEQARVLTAVYRQHNEARHDDHIKIFPGITDALSQLQATGVRMGVVTSKRHALAWRGCQVLGVDGYFDLLIAPDDFPAHKPDPGGVLEGCRRLGLDPATCAYVGDSPYDMQAGLGADCFTVAVTWGMFAEDLLVAEGPSAVCHRPEDLPAVLLG